MTEKSNSQIAVQSPPQAAASPALPRIEGPAFPPVTRLVATALVGVLLLWGWEARAQLSPAELGWQSTLFLGGVMLVIAYGYWTVMTSRTAIDGETLVQSGLWTKRVPLVEITQLKLVQLPGLAWIVVPRLVVRRKGLLLVTTFYAGSPALVRAFRRLAYGESD